MDFISNEDISYWLFVTVMIYLSIQPGPVYGLGAPGYFIWRGNLISMTSNSRPDISRLFGEGAVDDVSYLGYATTSGFFAVNNRLDYAVSVPRFGRYTGAVSIISSAMTGTWWYTDVKSIEFPALFVLNIPNYVNHMPSLSNR